MMFTARSPSLFEHDPRWKALNQPRRAVGPRTGVLPSQALHALIARKEIYAGRCGRRSGQVQPASLDLRLGPIAYRIRASFLPGKGGTVESKLSAMQSHVIDLSKGAVLETECVYLVPLHGAAGPALDAVGDGQPEELHRPPRRVHAPDRRRHRLVRLRPAGLRRPPLHRDIAAQLQHPGAPGLPPQPAARAAPHTRQARDKRFLSDAELRALHKRSPLRRRRARRARRLNLRVDLTPQTRPAADRLQGQALCRRRRRRPVGGYEVRKFWEQIYDDDNGRLILDPHEFYILASKEARGGAEPVRGRDGALRSA